MAIKLKKKELDYYFSSVLLGSACKARRGEAISLYIYIYMDLPLMTGLPPSHTEHLILIIYHSSVIYFKNFDENEFLLCYLC